MAEVFQLSAPVELLVLFGRRGERPTFGPGRPDPTAHLISFEDGPVFISAGVTEGIDLALAMVEADAVVAYRAW